MRVIRLKEHHCTILVDATDLPRAALSILRGRFGCENPYYSIKDEESVTPLTPPSVTRELAESLPDGPVKQAAKEEWDIFDRVTKAQKLVLAQNTAIKRALLDQDGKLALKILEARRRYEDEDFDIIEVEPFYPGGEP